MSNLCRHGLIDGTCTRCYPELQGVHIGRRIEVPPGGEGAILHTIRDDGRWSAILFPMVVGYHRGSDERDAIRSLADRFRRIALFLEDEAVKISS